MAKIKHNFSQNGDSSHEDNTFNHGNTIANSGLSDVEFKDLYKKSFLKAVHYSNQYVNNYELAKEIAQESFISLWEKRHSISHQKGSVEYYLITIVRNNSFNAIRNKIRETNRIGKPISIDDRINSIALSQDPVDELTYQEMSKIISETIGGMSQKIKEVYLLSREQEMTYMQIAQELDVSIKTVEYRISKALALFRNSLAKYMPVIIGLLLSIALSIINITATITHLSNSILNKTISIFLIILTILNLFVSFNLGATTTLV